MSHSCMPIVLLLASFAAAQSYSVSDLGVVSQIGGLNDTGTVVGTAPGTLAFVWTSAQGTTTLPPFRGGKYSVANGVNANGLVAGYSSTDRKNAHAAVWLNGKPQDLGALGSSDFASQGFAINAVGQVAGVSGVTGALEHAFLWTKASGMRDLGTLPGGNLSSGLAVNVHGQVVGYSNGTGINYDGFVWSEALGMQDLGALPGGSGSTASGINDLGQIAGTAGCAGGGIHAALWSKNGKVQDLGTLTNSGGSGASAINNGGQVVGSTFNPTRAFVWTAAFGMQDLNNLIPVNSGWLLGSAIAINDSGQIVGVGTLNGANHGFLLTPTTSGSQSSAKENGPKM